MLGTLHPSGPLCTTSAPAETTPVVFVFALALGNQVLQRSRFLDALLVLRSWVDLRRDDYYLSHQFNAMQSVGASCCPTGRIIFPLQIVSAADTIPPYSGSLTRTWSNSRRITPVP